MDTERFLLTACESAGVNIAWDARVAGVRVSATGVALTTDDGRVWTGSHVIAADGARSAVRRELNIPMEGTRSAGFHVVADVADIPAAELPAERVFHYEHPGTGGRSVMRVPFTRGFQVDLQCRDDDLPESYGTEEGARGWLPRVVGDGYADLLPWVSTYRFLRKVAAEFTDPGRRVLLVGEAAHLFPPFGARGMNSGIADAASAAAAVAAGTPDAVEKFATDRRAAALVNSAAAGAALEHLRPRRRIVRAQQRVAAALAPVPTRDAVTYWDVAETPPTGDDPLDALTVRLAAAYEDPRLLKFHLDDVGSTAGRAAELADPGLRVGTRDEVLTAGDYLCVYVLEWTLHHLDLLAHLRDAAEPPAEGLALSREMLEKIAGSAFPVSFSDKDALLVGTGRRAPTEAETAELGKLPELAAKLPLFLG